MSNNLRETIGEITPDNLFAGQEIVPIIKPVTLAADIGILTRGAVLGLEAGKCKLVDSEGDGDIKTPYAILAESVDTTGTQVSADAYFTGVFNRDALIFGGSDTVDTHESALRSIGIHLKTNVSY